LPVNLYALRIPRTASWARDLDRSSPHDSDADRIAGRSDRAILRFVPVRNSLSADDREIVFGAGIAICGAA